MENESLDGLAVGGVDADSSAQGSSPEPTQQVDVVKNIKAEMNRKFSKINETLQIILQQNQKAAPVEETVEEASDYKRYVDSRFSDMKKEEAKQAHQKDYADALSIFPELNPDSDNYDAEFYKQVDTTYTKLIKADPTDPNALKDAVELVSSKTGKSERLIKERLLRDEARRSRLLAEGGTIPREAKKEKEPSFNADALGRLGLSGKKLDRLKAEIKKQGDR